MCSGPSKKHFNIQGRSAGGLVQCGIWIGADSCIPRQRVSRGIQKSPLPGLCYAHHLAMTI